MIPRGYLDQKVVTFFVIIFTLSCVETRSLYLRCFQRFLRHSIDNSQPITELFYISPLQCLDQCILTTNNAKQDGLCKSFVYNHLQHSCRLYSHNGNQIPAIMHPANGYDFYKRTAITGECAGPLQRFYDTRANKHLIPVGAAPTSLKPNKVSRKKEKPVIESQPPPTKPQLPEPPQRHRDQQEFIIDPKQSINQEIQIPEKAKEFKEYVDSEDDYSDFDKSKPTQQTVSKASFGKKTNPRQPLPQQDEYFERQSNLDGFPKYPTRPVGQHSKYDVRPGSTGGLPGGSAQIAQLPNSAAELGYVDTATPNPTGSRGYTPWRTRLPPATRAPPPRPEPEVFRPEPEVFKPRPPPPPPEQPRPRPTSAPSSPRSCATTTGYYVVIGNEIILPVTGSENDVRIYHGVEQSKCAQYCSSGTGPANEKLQCSSINYFPLTQKCEIYNILAEPHGPGSLVENDDVIYAEKFCLPSHRGSCQEDEIFILHVQMKLSSGLIRTSKSNSITSCLQACLNAPGCQAASFDSNRRRCLLHTTSIGDNPDAAEEADPGWVLIENGCTSKRKSQKLFGAKRREVDVDIKPDPAYQWSEWSSCRFKIAGKQTVRVRTRKCKERCADGGLQIERC